MASITKPRASSVKPVKRDKRPLAASAVVWKGGLAACNASGFFGPATGDPTEVVVGRFYESVSNSGGANAAKSANVEFFRERELFLVDNDGGSPCVSADRERYCYQLDDHTATKDSSKGILGVVYDVTTEGVFFEFCFPASTIAEGLPRFQAGTTTLIAGTKTVSGINVTATSRILITMKDPGAGAITGMAGFDVPVGTRTVGAAGSFVINAIDDAKAVITTAIPTVDYLVIG